MKSGEKLLAATAIAISSAIALPAYAQVISLGFEGLKDQESIASYYNGGLGGSGSGPGTNYGITFSSNALAIISDQSGGAGNFTTAGPSGPTAMFFLSGSNAFLDDAAGFQNGFSLFYSAINNPGSLSVYSGLDGTGTLLGTLALPTTPAVPANRFDPFVAAGLSFSGTARSISFAGVQNQIAFDDVTFGSPVPGATSAVPEPAAWAMTILGFGLAGAGLRRRRKVTTRVTYAA